MQDLIDLLSLVPGASDVIDWYTHLMTLSLGQRVVELVKLFLQLVEPLRWLRCPEARSSVMWWSNSAAIRRLSSFFFNSPSSPSLCNTVAGSRPASSASICRGSS